MMITYIILFFYFIPAALQSQLTSLQLQYDTNTKRLEERIEKLEGDLRAKTATRRRVVQPTVVVPVESPSTTVTAQAGEGRGGREGQMVL